MPLETYGRYQLLKKLATGGMAQIFLARQVGPEGFEKDLVVKRILPHLAENDEFITMFLDEARIAARLNHPNVVQIFDLGAQDDSFFIAMEFIHGEDVRRVWKHADKVGKPLPVPLICRIIIEACAGLDYAHKKLDASGRPLHIVHRDISPQNILVSFEGAVKIVDFGIAKAADQATVTRSGVLKGKYSYMSPEQAGGQGIDCRTDIFALGVVLYELLTATRLFKRSTDIQTLNAVTDCVVAPPSEVNDRIPKSLDAIVMKALTRDREDRYGEARQLAAALEGWLLASGHAASTAVLAEFMREIYAERLAREAEEGRLLVETAESSRGEEVPAERERATPSLEGMKRPTRSLRATQSAARPHREVEETAAERPTSRSGLQPRKSLERIPEVTQAPPRPVPELDVRETSTRTDASQATDAGRRPRGRLLGLAVALLVGVAALAGMARWLRDEPPPVASLASLRVESDPPGATVKRGGEVLCETPCAPEGLPPGEVELELEKEGYLPVRRRVSLTASSAPSSLVVSLTPLATPRPLPVVVMVPVLIQSEPSGAAVTIDGVDLGVAPVTKELEVGKEVEVRLVLPGFVPVTERLTVAEDEAPHRFTLKPEKGNAVRPTPPRPQPTEARVQPAGTGRGKVRFIVKPWAVVECRDTDIKEQSPFPEKVIPAGRYQCTFQNPEFPTQVREVVVQAGETTKVQVSFTP